MHVQILVAFWTTTKLFFLHRTIYCTCALIYLMVINATLIRELEGTVSSATQPHWACKDFACYDEARVKSLDGFLFLMRSVED